MGAGRDVWLTNRLSAPLTADHRRMLVEALSTWNFKPHELDEGDLYRLATLMFEAVLSIEGVVELDIHRGESRFVQMKWFR